MIKTIRELIQNLFPYKKKMVWGISLLIFSVVLEVISPKLLGRVIDELNSSEGIDLALVFIYAGFIIGIMLVRGVTLFYMRYILIGTSRHVEYDMRNRLYKHMLNLEPNFFHKYKTGDLISRLSSDFEQVRMIYGPGIMYTANVVLLTILCLISMVAIDPILTLCALIPMITLTFIIKIIGKKYYERSKQVQEELAKLTTFVNENLQGVRVLKSYVKEQFAENNFAKLNKTYIKRNLDLAKLSGFFRPVFIFIAGVSSIVIMWVGGIRIVESKTMTIGNLVEFLRYIEILSMPLMAMGWVISIFQRGNASYQRIQKIASTEPTISDTDVTENISDLEGNINIQNLTFSYDRSDHPALQNVSFQIKRGEKVALIGPTGSGKTTMVSLLLRLYEAPPFTIFFDNIPIKEIPLKTLRAHFGYVPQENFFFPESIFENIHFGNRGTKDMSNVVEVSKLAFFNDDIESFPKQYEEVVGEQGITLSGGQKQRLGIARALSGKPSIFIFDDSFSNIDSSTEKKILDNLHKDYQDNTVIIVAHRASTIRYVDKIIVLDHGRLVESGSPDELVDAKGYYAHLLEHEKLAHDLKEVK